MSSKMRTWPSQLRLQDYTTSSKRDCTLMPHGKTMAQTKLPVRSLQAQQCLYLSLMLLPSMCFPSTKTSKTCLSQWYPYPRLNLHRKCGDPMPDTPHQLTRGRCRYYRGISTAAAATPPTARMKFLRKPKLAWWGVQERTGKMAVTNESVFLVMEYLVGRWGRLPICCYECIL